MIWGLLALSHTSTSYCTGAEVNLYVFIIYNTRFCLQSHRFYCYGNAHVWEKGWNREKPLCLFECKKKKCIYLFIFVQGFKSPTTCTWGLRTRAFDMWVFGGGELQKSVLTLAEKRKKKKKKHGVHCPENFKSRSETKKLFYFIFTERRIHFPNAKLHGFI